MTFLSDAINLPQNLPQPASHDKAETGIDRLIEVSEETGDASLISDIKNHTTNIVDRKFLEALFGNSTFLSQCAVTDPHFFSQLIMEGPEASFKKIEQELVKKPNNSSENLSEPAVMKFLRIMRKRAALTIASADIANLWSGAEVTQALSRFSDLSVGYAVDFLLNNMAEKAFLTLPDESRPGDGSGLIVLGMGKLGGHELNYSSDIDLILFFDPEVIQTDVPENLQKGFIRLARGLVKILSERTADGYVFRTDLRLRPDPGSTPPAISVLAAETYYESIGQNWERAAMIKARPIAGDFKAAETFLERLHPFIWRKYLDFATIQDVHSIKRQINAHRGSSVVAVEGHNVKLGRGGIREIEFFAQTQQLIWGGRLPELRTAPTCESLNALAKAGQISQATADELITSYWFLRRVEHHLQMIDDQQTHDLPTDAEGIEHIALFLGFDNSETFRAELLSHLNCVEAHYAELFEEAPSLDGTDDIKGNLIFTGADDDPDTLKTIEALGFLTPSSIAETVRSWHHGRHRATSSTRARQTLTELIPVILKAFGESTEPDVAFHKFDDFLSGLPAGIQLFSMFHAHPELLNLVAEIMGSAPRLAEHLGRNPGVLDSVLQQDFFDHLPGSDQLDEELSQRLAGSVNIEDTLDIVRRWANDRRLQIGIQALRHRSNWQDIGMALTTIADISIQHLLKHVGREFAVQHGQVKGGEGAVLALGKAGGQEMTPSSDLDLIFVYRHDEDAELSDGERPLAPSQYFARLSQRLINAITAPTTEGTLYEVDMRLRPSGNAGPIASHFSAFVQYHQEKSWTWEHMALSRARCVTGAPALIKDIEEVICETLTKVRDPETLLKDVQEMRQRIDKEHHSNFIWEVKYMRGGLVDIEFTTQYLQLKHAQEHPDLLAANTSEALNNLAEKSLLDEQDAAALLDALNLWQTVQGMLRLTIEGYFRPDREDEIPAALTQALATAGECEDIDALKDLMQAKAEGAFKIFNKIVGAPSA
ncbi:MAG: bifunctional [glutamine synthetase] adenylyltransferase/[glutamine synthetase]-adenylyl-L-tyrosine phosphorylase [Rhodospirillaceae bacterium]|nr:bifunctional [glutamine synthetase] adenylyltransferase/[glutamine synthetase]-adenylyl-L-tyrosine phosphorylase [Rhodospirillaceae bacterium]MBT4587848.1 bifunctional [glutamine synthetase] adenylyltransferase/[glutamine synthetase]-adenylyl-L-tyrosine phosphorylase [Rhodospirillaceae bacterium]MBT5939218.1 bifunctional [glutamine synthetase] adenylyltransferase/[glutamine synthetase]-adenylyl-L-tyrosine phosphorylase [Rhodospirillaceae bacterium]MBT7267347.1 bifunctional [glutamine syntheta